MTAKRVRSRRLARLLQAALAVILLLAWSPAIGADSTPVGVTQFGTNGTDTIFSVATDSAGGVYVAGQTNGALPGQSAGGGLDAFVRKYDASGAEVWTHQFGSIFSEKAEAVAVRDDAIYVAGTTGSTIFLRAYDLSGAFLSEWTKNVTAFDVASLAVDAEGTAYIAGGIEGGAGQLEKVDAAGTEQWDIPSLTRITSVAVAPDGSIVIAEYGDSAGRRYGWVKRIDPATTDTLWLSSRLGGNTSAQYNAVAIGADGSVYAAGTIDSDAFATKFDASSGQSAWFTRFGNQAQGLGLAVTNAEHDPAKPARETVAVTGFIAGSNALPGQTSTGSTDAFAQTFYAVNGALRDAHQFGSTGSDYAYAIAADPLGNLFIGGYTTGAFDGFASAGGQDAFVAELPGAAFAPVVTGEPADQTVAAGQAAVFDAVALGNPAPSVQWQVSADGGTSYSDVPGATATSFSLTPVLAESGHRYRAVFTNGQGSATTTAATLTVQPAIIALTVDASSVLVDPGQPATNGGTYTISTLGITPSFTASIGTVTALGHGTWSWTLGTTAAIPTQMVTIAATDATGGSATATFELINKPPTLSVFTNAVVVVAGQTAMMTGTYGDASEEIALTASVGTLARDTAGIGTWTWSFQTTSAADSQPVTITAADSAGQTATAAFQLTVQPYAAPALTARPGDIIVGPGQTATNTGTYFNAHGGTPTLTASVGTVTRISDPSQYFHQTGTWSWSLPTDTSFEGAKVTITASEDGGPAGSVSFNVVPAQPFTMTLTSATGSPVFEEGKPPTVVATVARTTPGLPSPTGLCEFYDYIPASAQYPAQSILIDTEPLEDGAATAELPGLFGTTYTATAICRGPEILERAYLTLPLVPSASAYSLLPSSTQFAGQVNAVGADPRGNVFAAGIRDGHGFLRKSDSTGVEIWTHTYTAAEIPRALAVTPEGAVYVAGETSGTMLGQTSAGGRDGFVGFYGSDGTEQWVHQFGSTADDFAYGVAFDPRDHNRVVIVGTTYDHLPGQINHGGVDAFARQYEANGVLDWTQQFGSNTTDELFGVAMDDAGRIVATGYTGGALPGEPSRGSEDHVLLAQFDTAGDVQWLSQFHAGGTSRGTSIAFGSDGAIYVAGWTQAQLPGQPPVLGNRDAFVRKYDPLGVEIWTRQFGTDGVDAVYGVSTGIAGVVVAGTAGGALPEQTSSGGADVFARSFGSDGSTLEDWQFGSGGDDAGKAVAEDVAGRIIVAGTLGATDGFVDRLEPRPVMITQPASQSVREGTAATFLASAFSLPLASVRWQVSADGGTTFTDLAGSTPQLSVVASRVENGFEYRALFTNGAGTTASQPATLTVQLDNVAPTITAPGDFSVPAASSSGAVVDFTASATDDVDGTLSAQCVPASGATFPVGATLVTCTATDAANNTGSASFTVTVTADTIPPTIQPASDVIVEATSPTGAAVMYSLPSASDDIDPAPAVTCAPASGSTFPIGTTPVTCTATDAFGNAATSSFSVNVADSTLPVVTTVPVSVLVEATSAAGSAVSFTASATDTIDGTLPVTCSPASGSTFPIGETDATCTASDAHGNTGSAQVHVVVRDTTAPIIVPPGPVSAEATGADGAAVSFAITATDLVDASPMVSCTPAAGSTFPIGATMVSCTATDQTGNAASSSFTVTVADTTPPLITTTGDVSAEAVTNFQTGGGTRVTFSATATDLVDGGPTAAICQPGADTLFPLGPTTVTCTSTDTHGNIGTATLTVTIVDTTPPKVLTSGDITVEAQSAAGAVATFNAIGSDIVDVSDHASCVPASGTVFPLGATTVTCTATDQSNNTGTASFAVNVVDTTPPVVTVPAPISVGSPVGGAVSVDYVATASDLIDGTSAVTCTPIAGSAFPLGTTNVSCTSTDAHGNTGTAEFPVTVIDRTVPVVTTSGDTTVEAGQGYRTIVNFSASATDVHDGTLPVTCTPVSGFNFGLGTTTVTCTATDPAGNVGTATLNVTVQDTTPPVLTLPAPIAVVAHAVGGATVTYDASANDLGLDLGVTCEPASGSVFPIGQTTVNCTSTDRPGNTAAGSFTVAVSAPAPMIGPASNVTAEATSPGGANVSFALPRVSDELDPAPTVSASPASGSLFSIGSTSVTVTATNTYGLTATTTFVVTVADTTPPALTLPAPVSMTSLSAAGTPVSWTASALDLVDGSLPVSCAPASGSLFGLGTTPVQCSVSDARGNAASGSFAVTIVDQPPSAAGDPAETLEETPVTIAVLANDTDADGGTLALASVGLAGHGTVDANTDGTVTYTPADAFIGTDTFTYVVADGQGGSTSGMVTVTVKPRPVHHFVVMSVDHTRLDAGVTVVSGNIGANTSLASPTTELVIGPHVTMQDPASTIVGDSVWLQSRASVYNVEANELYARGASVLGTRTESVTLPFLTLPALPAIDAGHQELTVRRHQTITLDAGAYGHVRVERGGTLVLTGGLYQLASLDLDGEANLVYRAQADVRIEGDLETGGRARIIPDATVSGLTAASLMIEVHGRQEDHRHRWQAPARKWLVQLARSAVRIGSQGVIHANIFAPEGGITIGARTEATGAFVGAQVFVGPQVKLTLDSAF